MQPTDQMMFEAQEMLRDECQRHLRTQEQLWRAKAAIVRLREALQAACDAEGTWFSDTGIDVPALLKETGTLVGFT